MSYVNKSYWNNFYKDHKNLNEHSTFSEYVLNHIQYSNKEVLIVDLGCGTGKDTFFFANKGFEVLGIDGSETVIDINNKKRDMLGLDRVIKFKCVDLSEESNVQVLMKELNEYAVENDKIVVMYNRFFLHAITEEVENTILQNVSKYIMAPCIIMAEFRTKEDEELDKVFNDHFRRYIETNQLLKKILELQFTIKSFYKGRGLSIYKEENPYLARVIFDKQ